MKIIYSNILEEKAKEVMDKLPLDATRTHCETTIFGEIFLYIVILFVASLTHFQKAYIVVMGMLVLTFLTIGISLINKIFGLDMYRLFLTERLYKNQNKKDRELYQKAEHLIRSLQNQEAIRVFVTCSSDVKYVLDLDKGILKLEVQRNEYNEIKSFELNKAEVQGIRETGILDFSYLDKIYQEITASLL